MGIFIFSVIKPGPGLHGGSPRVYLIDTESRIHGIIFTPGSTLGLVCLPGATVPQSPPAPNPDLGGTSSFLNLTMVLSTSNARPRAS